MFMYVVIRIKMAHQERISLCGSLSLWGNLWLLVGHSYLHNEILVVCDFHNYSHLAWFHLATHQRIYLYQAFDAIDHLSRMCEDFYVRKRRYASGVVRALSTTMARGVVRHYSSSACEPTSQRHPDERTFLFTHFYEAYIRRRWRYSFSLPLERIARQSVVLRLCGNSTVTVG